MRDTDESDADLEAEADASARGTAARRIRALSPPTLEQIALIAVALSGAALFMLAGLVPAWPWWTAGLISAVLW